MMDWFDEIDTIDLIEDIEYEMKMNAASPHQWS